MIDDEFKYGIEFYKEGKSTKRTAWYFLNQLGNKNDQVSFSLFNAIYHQIGLLRQLGPLLPMPHSRKFKGRKQKIRELRLKHVTGYHRIFYCPWVSKTFVLLNHFVKDTDDTPPEDISLAESLMDDWLRKKGGKK